MTDEHASDADSTTEARAILSRVDGLINQMTVAEKAAADPVLLLRLDAGRRRGVVYARSGPP